MVFRLALLAALLTSCAAPARPPQAAPPSDFSLSLTIVGDSPAAPDLEPAWYVLEPDGLLRAALGQRQAVSPIPPVVRRLTETQFREVWDATRESGALEAPVGGVQVADSVLPRQGAAVSVSADGVRRTRVYEGPPDRFAALSSLLRRLAWVSGA